MAKLQQPNPQVLQARARRKNAAAQNAANIEWYIKEVSDKVTMTLKQRMEIAVEYTRTKVVKNLSVPVVYGISSKGNKIVVERSKKGEFPRAETTMLMKTIFGDVRHNQNGSISGYVGTPIDYGVRLELEMDRSFLVRTLMEEKQTITKLLTGPIRG